ncbi:rhodanese-related sulfurtransferase [Sphingomonas montana]|uniref:oxygen-dependent tRNA uridine(34) hydroxylase TrhO n=1 Tax=Sphingomonas montana TaxID=1843236 RepID=UPI00096C6B67|nr:rhodanese-related sulfurtransferase [Sphingomonas montana]
MLQVAALYRFTRLPDPRALREPLFAACVANGVKGTLLLAAEGINGTVAGPTEGLAAVLDHIRTLPGCADIAVKYSETATMPFHRMKVRLKREIVTMGEPEIDPLGDVGHYVPPAEWNALIADPGTLVIDTRNDYEVAIGSFANAVDPQTQSFRDFPAWFRANRDAIAPDTRIAMFCTGGIRCEKATAFLKAEGLTDVHHLEGGILKYLETVPPAESLWHGECFVFDERVAVGHGLVPGTHDLCRACRRPVSAADRASPLFVAGESCPACHAVRNAEQRAGYAERHRQVALAQHRGEPHVGARRA